MALALYYKSKMQHAEDRGKGVEHRGQGCKVLVSKLSTEATGIHIKCMCIGKKAEF